MGISNVQFKDLIQASPLVGKNVKFTEGQVVSGKILSVTEKGAIISLAGNKILAQTNVSLQEGSSIKAQIEVASDDKIVLRILEQKTGSHFTFQSLEDGDIENVLLKLGVAGEPRSLTAAKALLSAALAVNTENIDKILAAMQKLNIETLPDAKALAFLIGRNIPLNKTTLEFTAALLSGAKIGELIGDAATKLSAISQMEPFKALISQLNSFSAALNFESAPAVESSLRSAVKNISFSPPMLASLKAALTPEESASLVKSLAGDAQQFIQSIDRFALKQIGLSSKVVQQAGGLLTTILSESPASGQSVSKLLDILPEIIAKAAKYNPNLADKLSSVLFKLSLFSRVMNTDNNINFRPALNDNIANAQDVLKSVFLGENKTINLVGESIGKISTNLTAQQMVSNTVDLAPAPQNIMYMQIPFKLDDNYRTLEIAIRGDETQAKTIDPDNTSVNLFLTMPNLGDIAVNVNIHDSNLDASFVVDDQRIKEAIDKGLSELGDNLQDKVKGSVNIDSTVRAKKGLDHSVEEILMPIDSRKMDMYI